jgi:replication factor A1
LGRYNYPNFINFYVRSQVYQISKGAVKPANKRFNSLPHEYEISGDINTVVEQCSDSEMETNQIPTIHFNFTTFEQIKECQKDTVLGKQFAIFFILTFPDLIGVVGETNPISNFKSKQGRELTKRLVTLIDTHSMSVDLTLWGQVAENIGWREGEHPVLAIKSARISDFNGN